MEGEAKWGPHVNHYCQFVDKEKIKKIGVHSWKKKKKKPNANHFSGASNYYYVRTYLWRKVESATQKYYTSTGNLFLKTRKEKKNHLLHPFFFFLCLLTLPFQEIYIYIQYISWLGWLLRAKEEHVVKRKGECSRVRGPHLGFRHVWTTPKDVVCWRQLHVTINCGTPVKMLFGVSKFQN